MYKFRLLLIFLFICLSLNSQSLFFDHLGVDNGLSQSTVQSIYQDELGQIWLGTRDGLNKYNGNEIVVLRPPINNSTDLTMSSIKTISGNKRGTIFMLSNLGLIFYDISKESFSDLITSQASTIYYGEQRLWIGHKNRLSFIADSSNAIHSYKTFDKDITIQSILQLPNKDIYVGTNKSVLRIDANGREETIVDNVNITCLYKDSKDRVWIGTLKDGLFCYSSPNAPIQYAHNSLLNNTLTDNFVRCIAEDDNGNYWIGTYRGLNLLNINTNQIIPYHHSENDKHTVSDFSIHAIEKDSQGSLWIGTYFGGVNIINPNFSFIKYSGGGENTKQLSSGIVSNVIEDNDGNLWICTDDAGLNFFDRKNNRFKHFKHIAHNIRSLTTNALKALCIDEENKTLWIGSNLGGLDKLDLTTHAITRSALTTGDPNIDNFVRGIIKYNDKLLIGTHNSVQLYNPKTKEVENVISEAENAYIGQVWDMFLDSDNTLWFSTFSEIYVVNLASKDYWKFSDKTGITTASAVFAEDEKHQLWIGTGGQGLYRYNLTTNEYENYKTDNSAILNNYILDIEQTKSGKILLSTNSGLSMLNTQQNTFKNYSNNQFFPFSSFNERSLYITKNEDIVLCSTSGMIIIKEEDLEFEPKPYTVNFSNLIVDNTPILPTNDNTILKSTISQADEIWLHESQSVFSIDVFTDNYQRAINPKIQYFLEGFDKEWIDARSKKTITYTNLNAGTYKLKIRSTDDFSTYKTSIRELTINIKPYFYKTWYAYLFYILVLLGIFYMFISRFFLINSLKYAKYKAAHIQEVNESKMRFFINVSHEIRTPITLIAAQIDYLLKGSDISNAVNNRLLNMRRNADKLKDLINELLDFQKHEQGLAIIEIEEIELVRYLKNILNTFKEYGYKLNIKSVFHSEIDSLYLYFDSVQMDKVFYNLLSNAYKFTPQNGEIILSVKKDDTHVTISVADTGIGIKQNEIAKVFSRFYQIEGKNKSLETSEVGTGIGLALVKDIVDLHHGAIVVSENEPQGTIFEISFPLDISVYEDDSNVKFLKLSGLEEPITIESTDPVHVSSTTSEENRHSIYIAEDNEDIRNILVDLFSPIYNVKSFADAEKAYEAITADLPNLVLLDVMLPKMTGTELCSRIKSNLNTQHIPVVLLTAAANMEKKIEGLQQGADDYITKPFNVEELLTRCNNLINNRVQTSRREINNETERDVVYGISDKDREFVANAESIVLQNIENVDLSIDILAERMNLSRTALFVKLKEILGVAPNKFVLDVKMKKALELLRNDEDIPIAETAYAVGYYSSSYFIKVFKSYYGMTPNEYKKQSGKRSTHNVDR